MVKIYETYIVPLSILIPILIALFNYRFLEASLKTILFFLVLSAILNLVALILATHGISNLFVFHIYTVFEFALISWFYKLNFKGWITRAIPFFIAVFTILCIVNIIFIQKKFEFNTYTRSLGAIVIIGYCALYLGRQNAVDNSDNWSVKGLNWINAGILIYYACCFFTFVFSNYLLTASKSANHIIWCAVDTILLLEYILFAVGFYKCIKQPTT